MKTLLYAIVISLSATACGNGDEFIPRAELPSTGGGLSIETPKTTDGDFQTKVTGGSSSITPGTGGSSTTSTTSPQATGGQTTTATTAATGGDQATGGTSGITSQTGGTSAIATSTVAATGGNTATGGSPTTGGTSTVLATGGHPATGGSPGTGGSKAVGHTCNQLAAACYAVCSSAVSSTCVYLSSGAEVLNDSSCDTFWNSYCTNGNPGTGGSSSISGTGGATGTGGNKATGGSVNSTGGATSITELCSQSTSVLTLSSYTLMPGTGVCYENTYTQLTSVLTGCSAVGNPSELDIGTGACPRNNYKLSCAAPASLVVAPKATFTIIYYSSYYGVQYSYDCNTCAANGSGWTCTQ